MQADPESWGKHVEIKLRWAIGHLRCSAITLRELGYPAKEAHLMLEVQDLEALLAEHIEIRKDPALLRTKMPNYRDPSIQYWE